MKYGSQILNRLLQILIGALVWIVALGSIPIYRYLNRPLFANYFGFHELQYMPSWEEPMPHVAGNMMIWIDVRLNIVAAIDVGENWSGSIRLTPYGKDIVVIVNGSERVRVTRTQDTLYLSPEVGMQDQYHIGQGEARKLNQLDSLDALKTELAQISAGSAK